MNKLTYLKEIFDRYVFVQKFSGSGWDPEEKHASNTEAYVTDFVKTYGNEYARCFNSPCPYWTELDALYSGLINKATGENVVHLGRQKKSRTTVYAQVPLKPISGSTSSDVEVPIEAAGRSVFDDELDVGPILHEAGNNRERVDDRSVNGNISKSALKRRHSEYGGVARRNAEAGMQISRALDHLCVVIAQPILTSEDLSHVNEVVAILKDASLLPDDPRGRLYRAVSAALSHDATLARVFILEQDRTRRIGILEGILEDAGLLV
ncbi:hypothetical protein B0H14DRAFT_3064089 [Mycena olivaceomarginata]|nr:hypothetical protein B0H14DRAFT_3064089 [Mycena olivaceomarginata]